jgi:hypothetical protein
MKSYNLNAFAIPIAYGTFGEQSRALNKILIHDIFEELNSIVSVGRSAVNVKQTNYRMEQRYSSFKILQDIIKEFALPYIQRCGIKKENIDVYDFWANLNQNPTAFHMPHSHSIHAGIFTGVYFPSSGIENEIHLSQNQNLDEDPQLISTGTPSPGSLVLLDPNENIKSAIATKHTEKYPYFGNPLCISPKEGIIILFPSYISHLVTPTENPNLTRLSIAFNIRVIPHEK